MHVIVYIIYLCVCVCVCVGGKEGGGYSPGYFVVCLSPHLVLKKHMPHAEVSYHAEDNNTNNITKIIISDTKQELTSIQYTKSSYPVLGIDTTSRVSQKKVQHADLHLQSTRPVDQQHTTLKRTQWHNLKWYPCGIHGYGTRFHCRAIAYIFICVFRNQLLR